MLGPYVFLPLLALICTYAFLKGGREERIVALLCLGGTIATRFLISPTAGRYAQLEPGLLLIDLLMLAGFVAVAIRTARFWPLWVAGLQLTLAFGHLLKSIDTLLLPKAYGASLIFWSYPILIILGVATWRSRRVARARSQLESDAAAV